MGSSKSTMADSSKPSNVRKNPCFKQSKSKLYADRDETGDVTFLIQSELIRAHSCILAALSPKYKSQFYGSLTERCEVKVTDVKPAAFIEFLQFFYMDEVKLTIENIEDVLHLAQQSLVDELVTECTHFLLGMVAVDKLAWCYRLAILCSIERLQKFCEEEISINIQRVFQTEDFLNCDHDVLDHILQLNELNCKEVEVFEAVIAWARVECKRIDEDDSNASNLRNTLGDAALKIRFCTMTVEEFADIHKKYANFFSTTESNEIIYGIGKVNPFTWTKLGLNRKYGPIWHIPSERVKGVECIFNNEPRKPNTSMSGKTKQDLMRKENKSCRIASSNEGKREPNECDMLVFNCDAPIQLNGFTVVPEFRGKCNFIDNLVVDIQIGSRQIENVPVVSEKLVNDVWLENPVEIAAHERCLITLKSKKFTEGTTTCYFAMKEVMENSIWFQFPNSKFGVSAPTLFINIFYKQIE